MNDDLISRSALKNFINKVCFSKEEERVKFRVDNGSRGQIERILAYIDNAPTVDDNEYNRGFMHAMIMVGKEAEERPQGEWIYGHLDYSTCSNCNYANHYGDFPFCPNCGADMRKEI